MGTHPGEAELLLPRFCFCHKKKTKMNSPSLQLVLFLAVLSTQAAQHRQKRSTKYYVYCPTGEKKLVLSSSDISEGNVRAKFEKYCQCDYSKARARYKHKWNYGKSTDDCSTILTSCSCAVARGDYGHNQRDGVVKVAKDACIIHEMCWQTGRDKSDCDDEFRHNFERLCYESPALGSHGTLAAAAIAACNDKVDDCNDDTTISLLRSVNSCDMVTRDAWYEVRSKSKWINEPVRRGGYVRDGSPGPRPQSNVGRDMMQCKRDEWNFYDGIDECNSPGCGT